MQFTKRKSNTALCLIADKRVRAQVAFPGLSKDISRVICATVPYVMSTGDQYRKVAAELQARAAKEQNELWAADLNKLARAYRRLAEQADRNSCSDIWMEYGPKPRLDGEGEGA